MLVKLTYYGTDRPTLVNLDNVESIYQVFDKMNRRYSTKICFRGVDSFINVEEDLQKILEISQNFSNGIYQNYEWVTPSVEERLESSFNIHKKRVNYYDKDFPERNYNFVEYTE